MINYELAKELKDAGFPQDKTKGKCMPFYKEGGGDESRTSTCAYYAATSLPPQEDIIKIPTLSELIEACGEEFDQLCKYDDCWRAWGKDGDPERGNTLEEAVVKLWLTLNK